MLIVKNFIELDLHFTAQELRPIKLVEFTSSTHRGLGLNYFLMFYASSFNWLFGCANENQSNNQIIIK